MPTQAPWYQPSQKSQPTYSKKSHGGETGDVWDSGRRVWRWIDCNSPWTIRPRHARAGTYQCSTTVCCGCDSESSLSSTWGQIRKQDYGTVIGRTAKRARARSGLRFSRDEGGQGKRTGRGVASKIASDSSGTALESFDGCPWCPWK